MHELRAIPSEPSSKPSAGMGRWEFGFGCLLAPLGAGVFLLLLALALKNDWPLPPPLLIGALFFAWIWLHQYSGMRIGQSFDRMLSEPLRGHHPLRPSKSLARRTPWLELIGLCLATLFMVSLPFREANGFLIVAFAAIATAIVLHSKSRRSDNESQQESTTPRHRMAVFCKAITICTSVGLATACGLLAISASMNESLSDALESRNGDLTLALRSVGRGIVRTSGSEVYFVDIGMSAPLRSKVRDDDLADIAKLESLEFLRLDRSYVTDAGLRTITMFPALRFLDVSSTAITDDGLIHLRQMNQLEQLNLTNTRVTAPGIQELRSALPDCLIVW